MHNQKLLYPKELTTKLKQNVESLNHEPILVIYRTDYDYHNDIYVANKVKFGKQVGIHTIVRKYDGPSNTEYGEFTKQLREDLQNPHIDGIMIQRPINSAHPYEYQYRQQMQADYHHNGDLALKDVEGVGENFNKLFHSGSSYLFDYHELTNIMVLDPGIKALFDLLKYYHVDLIHQNIAVIGNTDDFTNDLTQSLYINHNTVTRAYKLSDIDPTEYSVIINTLNQTDKMIDCQQDAILINYGSCFNDNDHLINPFNSKCREKAKFYTPNTNSIHIMTIYELYQQVYQIAQHYDHTH